MLLIGISVKVPAGAAATAAAAGIASTAGAYNQRRTALLIGPYKYQLQSSSVREASTEAMLSLASEQQTLIQSLATTRFMPNPTTDY